MKNILIIIQSLYGGGAERVAADLATALSDIYNVLLVTFDDTADSYQYDGSRICLDLMSKKMILKPVIAMRRIKALKKIKKENQIDCAISFLANANFSNVMSGCGEKSVVSVRNNITRSMGVMALKIEKMVCKKADMMVALSKGVEEDVAENFGLLRARTRTIYNMCDTDRILKAEFPGDSKPVSSEAGIDDGLIRELENHYCIVTCGSMRFQKGQWHLLKAFKIVLHHDPHVRLVIFGDGELRSQLMELAKKLEIEHFVYMPGFVKDPHWLMKKIGNQFCFSSLWEGFGNVLLEAMACGLPVVSYDCQHGPREIISGEVSRSRIKEIKICDSGVLVPLLDEDRADFSTAIGENDIMLAEGIRTVLHDDDLSQKLTENGLQRVRDFSKEEIMNQWKSLIEQMTA